MADDEERIKAEILKLGNLKNNNQVSDQSDAICHSRGITLFLAAASFSATGEDTTKEAETSAEAEPTQDAPSPETLQVDVPAEEFRARGLGLRGRLILRVWLLLRGHIYLQCFWARRGNRRTNRATCH
jgi:hypothetical protein